MAFKPSKYQRLVYTFIEKCSGNAVVNAVAGSGKSTTIVNALRIIPSNKKILFLAFNKSIVEELSRKVQDIPNVTVMTLHSLGAKACLKAYGCSVEDNKYITHFSEGILAGTYIPTKEQMSDGDYEEWKSNIRQLIELGRISLIKTKAQLQEIADKFELYLVDNELDTVMKVLRWGILNTDKIDFTDMVYFPVIKKLRLPQYDWVFVDECQDLNACQRELFQRCLKPGGRWIAVGDERQAIYGFAGADTESFQTLRKIPNTATIPLSICYRCDRDIITLSKTIVPQIEWFENAAQGVVDRQAKMADVKDGDMILCRLSAPLMSLCMKYLSENIKAYIKGKDVGQNLINIIKRTKRKNVPELLERLREDNEKLLERIMAKKRLQRKDAEKTSTYQAAVDKLSAIEVLSEGLKTSAAVIQRIGTIFSDEAKEGICLSTIHKSKGLEANRVFIICEDKLLFKPCMEIPWQAVQEYNLVYVAYTRAKHHLGFIQDFKYR